MLALGPRNRVCFLALLLLAGPGCGGKELPIGEVEGTVRWNRKPLPNVVVEFLPDIEQGTQGPRSTGVTDAQGRYSLYFDDHQPGAVVGHHRVVVREIGADPERDRKGGGHRSGQQAGSSPGSVNRPLRLDRYSKAATTPLQREVLPDKQTIDFNLP